MGIIQGGNPIVGGVVIPPGFRLLSHDGAPTDDDTYVNKVANGDYLHDVTNDVLYIASNVGTDTVTWTEQVDTA